MAASAAFADQLKSNYLMMVGPYNLQNVNGKCTPKPCIWHVCLTPSQSL